LRNMIHDLHMIKRQPRPSILPGQGHWVMEIKRGMEARPKRGFYQACADLQAARRLIRFMVYPGSDRYPLGVGVQAIGLQTLLAQLSA